MCSRSRLANFPPPRAGGDCVLDNRKAVALVGETVC
jgi:hypothetical protein